MPGNSHGAGAPSRGNAGAGKGSRQSKQGAPAPRSARPSQLLFSFFCLMATQRLRWRRPSRTGVGEGGNLEQAAARCSPRLPGLRGTPFSFLPPLRPTRSGAASLGEAAARRPLGAGSSLARFGGPGHPQWPPLPGLAPRTRRSGLARSLTINNRGIGFVWTV